MSFNELVGHRRQQETLRRIIREGRVSHSYLFQGMEGVGKLKLAKIFSKTLLCKEKGETYCDVCSSCIKFNSNNHPDFTLIAGGGNVIKKSEIDEIVAGVNHTPFESTRKIFIINNAHLMNKESMNGLLKTLEEPPGFLNIFLVTSKPEELLPTIRSRCQPIKLNPLSDGEILDYIGNNFNILPKEARTISKLANGSLGYAIEMVETGEILGLRKRTLGLVDGLLMGDAGLAYSSEKFFEASKDRIDEILNIMIYYFRDLAIYKETRSIEFLINQDMEESFRRHSLVDFSKIDRIIGNIEETRESIRGYVNYPLSIEMMLLNIWEENRW